MFEFVVIVSLATLFSLLTGALGFFVGRTWQAKRSVHQGLTSSELSELVEQSVRRVMSEEQTSDLLDSGMANDESRGDQRLRNRL